MVLQSLEKGQWQHLVIFTTGFGLWIMELAGYLANSATAPVRVKHSARSAEMLCSPGSKNEYRTEFDLNSADRGYFMEARQ